MCRVSPKNMWVMGAVKITVCFDRNLTGMAMMGSHSSVIPWIIERAELDR